LSQMQLFMAAAFAVAALILPRVWPLIKPYIPSGTLRDKLNKGIDGLESLSSLARKEKAGDSERFAMLLAWRDSFASKETKTEQDQFVIDSINQLIAVAFAHLNVQSSPLVAAGLTTQAAGKVVAN
jgi:hypothetical protein